MRVWWLPGRPDPHRQTGKLIHIYANESGEVESTRVCTFQCYMPRLPRCLREFATIKLPFVWPCFPLRMIIYKSTILIRLFRRSSLERQINRIRLGKLSKQHFNCLFINTKLSVLNIPLERAITWVIKDLSLRSVIAGFTCVLFFHEKLEIKKICGCFSVLLELIWYLIWFKKGDRGPELWKPV